MAPTDTPDDELMVFIVGAGIGGLLLGALLQKAKIQYHIFERAQEIKPLGSALALGPTILPALEQLGLLDEIEKISLIGREFNLLDKGMNQLGTLKIDGTKEIAGFEGHLMPRPEFHEILLRQIPPERISMNKRILQVKEIENRIRITCSDNTYYDGDILVGADGAYSAVRQNVYRDMEKVGILPKSDSENLIAGFTCMVGITKPLDTDKYPPLKDDFSHFATVQGGNSLSDCLGRFGIRFDDKEEARRQQFANSEWASEANAVRLEDDGTDLRSLLKIFRVFQCPFGGTLGDLIDATPPELISKVFLEYKLFETWYYGRSVLIGDACHKFLPSGGQGAANAMQDAVILANCLYDLKDRSQQSITATFQSYYTQRFSHAKEQYEHCLLMEKIFSGQRWTDKLVRKLIFDFLPHSVQQRNFEKSFRYRPQATFLPMVPFRGTGAVLPQLPSKRYQKEQADKKKKKEEEEEEQQGVVSV